MLHDHERRFSRHARLIAVIRRVDIVPVLALAIMAAIAAAWLGASVGPSFFRAPVGNDAWFEADLPQVHESLSSVTATQRRHETHPLYPLFATLPVSAFDALGLSDRTAILAWMSLVAALWAVALHVCLRLQGLTRIDAVTFTLVGLSSSSFVFWLSVPETFAIGSVAMLFTLAITAWPPEPDARLHVLAQVVTLGSTVTNGVCGALALAVRYPARRAVALAGLGLVVTLGVWGILHLVFPSLPLVLRYDDWRRFVLSPASGGPVAVARALLAHSIVMPAIGTDWDPKWGAIMSVQHATLGGHGWIAAVAAGCWLTLLGGGAAALARGRSLSALDRVLLGTIATQVLLHLVFGEQTFLYAIHVAPLLVLVASRVALTRARPLALALAAGLIIAGSVNNLARFREAARFLDHGRQTTVVAEARPPAP